MSALFVSRRKVKNPQTAHGLPQTVTTEGSSSKREDSLLGKDESVFMIPITLDDRERASGIMKALETSARFTITVKRLNVGDYQIDNRFLVERKTLTDLVQAIISGRLFSQATRLAKEHTLRPLIILEGTTKGLRKGQMPWEAIQGALVTVSVFYGIPILRSRCLEETVKTFTYLVDQARACKSGSIHRHALRPKGKEALQHHILQSLPGIGPKRADSLLENFQNIEAVVNAEESSLADIPGIGADTARKIRWAVREEPKAHYIC